MVQLFEENIVVLVKRLNELKRQDFFLDFIIGPLLQLTAGKYVIKLSVLKLWLRDDLETNTFRIRFVDKSRLLFSSI